MANIYRSALELIKDLAQGGHNPRDYAELLTEGQDAIARAPGAGFPDSWMRKQRMRDLLKVPADELEYSSMSIDDPKYTLGRAIDEYTGSHSGMYNLPFRSRKLDEKYRLSEYKDPHVKKQVQANELSSYLGDHQMKKIRALGQSFYPSPVDFVTWRGIPVSSRTLKGHYEHLSPQKTIKQLEEELATQRSFLDKFWEEATSKYGQEYEQWPEATKSAWNFEVGKQNTLGSQYQQMSQGYQGYVPPPSLEKFPLYEDYGSEAFLSTSVDRPIARSFADDDRGMFKILVPEGTPIRPVFPYSSHDTEMEVLLPPRSLYKRIGERTPQGDVPLLYTGRGRPDSDKYIGAALPIGAGLEAYGGYDESE